MSLDKERKLNIHDVEIVKRTFEGVNDDPIRSKYRTSYRYAVKYDIENYEHNPVIQCFRTKKDAQGFIDKLKETHIVE